ncbi:MAG TPA: DUF937 domain-containing protein [Bacillota bacterium]|nr:DUF937 domain-containing protein [Bacillota bacterium]
MEKALRDHQDDPVEDVFNFLQGVDIEDGAKILGHIFSSKKEQVQKDLAGKTGLTVEQVVAVLTQLAPLVLGALGNEKKKKEKEKSSAGDLGDLLGGLLGSLLK